MYSAYTGVPYKGRVYDEQDVLMGLATGIKPYEVDINKTVDFLINDYTKIRSKAFDASVMYNTDTHGDAVINDFIRIQRNIFREQRRIYRAFQTAKKFGVTNSTLRKELRARRVSFVDIQKILSGKMDPLPFSKIRFKGKLEERRQMWKDRGFAIPPGWKNEYYPRRKLEKVLRFLINQRLNDEFKYDKFSTPTIPKEDQTSMIVPDKKVSLAANTIQTPPLPKTAMPDQRLVASMPQTNLQTGLTRTQSALLSPSEQVIARRT